jgi:hypothetical protein
MTAKTNNRKDKEDQQIPFGDDNQMGDNQRNDIHGDATGMTTIGAMTQRVTMRGVGSRGSGCFWWIWVGRMNSAAH